MSYPQEDFDLDQYDLKLEKAKRERILAERDQLELDIVKKNLVLRDDVHKTAFESARKLRDRLHSVCKQTAPVVISLESPADIEQFLREELDAALEEFIQSCAS